MQRYEQHENNGAMRERTHVQLQQRTQVGDNYKYPAARVPSKNYIALDLCSYRLGLQFIDPMQELRQLTSSWKNPLLLMQCSAPSI